MIDTIKIMIPTKKIKIHDYEIFQPTAKGFFEMPFYVKNIKVVRNCSKKELENGRYFPKLTITKIKYGESFQAMLFIEFSIPKLMFNNNFEEVDNTYFEIIIEKLQEKLLQRGIEIQKEDLMNAEVLSVHYSKNIELHNVSSKFIINTISKINIPQNIDIAKTDYRNDGVIIRFHTNSYEFVFYDKIADLQQSLISEKRAIETDNKLQSHLLQYKEFFKKEILRMEVRLNARKKIKNIFRNCNIELDALIFQNLFDKNIAKTVLNFFWDKYIAKSISTICLLEEDISVLQEKILQTGIPKTKMFTLLGIILSIKASGIKITKEILKSHNFLRYKRYYDQIKLNDNYLFTQFQKIKSELQKMLSIKL